MRAVMMMAFALLSGAAQAADKSPAQTIDATVEFSGGSTLL